MPSRSYPARYTRSLSLRMTDEDFALVDEHAEARGLPTSEALRELVTLGSVLGRASRRGLAVTNAAAGLLGQGVQLRFVTELHEDSIATLEREGRISAETAAQLRAGAVLAAIPEDFSDETVG